jgi:hypothetical protein
VKRSYKPCFIGSQNRINPHSRRRLASPNQGYDTRVLQVFPGQKNIYRYSERSPTRWKKFWRE